MNESSRGAVAQSCECKRRGCRIDSDFRKLNIYMKFIFSFLRFGVAALRSATQHTKYSQKVHIYHIIA